MKKMMIVKSLKVKLRNQIFLKMKITFLMPLSLVKKLKMV
jgi:hypothetical protein